MLCTNGTNSPKTLLLLPHPDPPASWLIITIPTLKPTIKIPPQPPNFKDQDVITDLGLFTLHGTLCLQIKQITSYFFPVMCFSVAFIFRNERAVLLYFKLVVCDRSTLHASANITVR